LLRDQVTETLEVESVSPGRKPFHEVAAEWRNILFPVAGDQDSEMDFADSYAQAVTFALLLARVDGISFEGRSPAGIAEQLSKQHSLLGVALGFLANPRWVQHLNVVGTLQRIIGNIDWSQVRAPDRDMHAELYETFLADYDPELRQRSGTYYTPIKVARAMVGLVDDVLRTRLGKKRGFAAEDVVTLDPAMGAGTFLAEVLDRAADNVRRERRSSTNPTSHLTELSERRLIGFELQAAPFAVAELRLHSALKNRHHVEIPREEPRFLTNALDNPDEQHFDYGVMYEVLKDSRKRANEVKRDINVMVVIGNPPWRENARGAAPWLEARRDPRKPVNTAARPSMDEFRPDNARLAYNLSNLWTFFWRWAAWKAFEANDPGGVVALITPSAYLTSAAYSGMRRYLRELADEGWIIDLSPEQHRSAVSTRIFPTTQHTICIGIFVRSEQPRRDVPATVHHVDIAGSKEEKIARLGALTLESGSWRTCGANWDAAFRPSGGAWEDYPLLGDLLPWRRSGVKSNRNWVWAPSPEILRARWERLIHADEQQKSTLFKETEGREIGQNYPAQPGVPSGELAIVKERRTTPRITPVGIHTFDRQYLVHDRRVVDRHRPELWQVSGPDQIYVSEQHAHAAGDGPGLAFSALVPGMHYFNNRGGRVLPLYRGRSAEDPNLAPGLLAKLARFVGIAIGPEDFLAYLAGVIAHTAYTARFRDELRTPGIRVPITLDRGLWRRAVRLGREIVWLHTFGERFVDEAAGRPAGPPRPFHATYRQPVPAGADSAPDSCEYAPSDQTLRVGSGVVHPVAPEVFKYQVGGKAVVSKWLDFRMRRPRHRKVTSPLDEINSTRWTAEFDDQLLEVLEVIRRCVALEPAQRELLEEICAGPVVTVRDLEREGVFPVPASARKPPGTARTLFSGD
jgi:hypothetical protein